MRGDRLLQMAVVLAIASATACRGKSDGESAPPSSPHLAALDRWIADLRRGSQAGEEQRPLVAEAAMWLAQSTSYQVEEAQDAPDGSCYRLAVKGPRGDTKIVVAVQVSGGKTLVRRAGVAGPCVCNAAGEVECK